MDFFAGIYQTALSPEELLIAVELPVARPNAVHFFHEFARRHGDYAIVGLAAQAVVEGGAFTDLRLAFFAMGDRPVLARAAERLIGAVFTPAMLADASAELGAELEPQQDHQASVAMRRHLAKVLLERCVAALLGHPAVGASA